MSHNPSYFIQIVGDDPIHIGDPDALFAATFNTGGGNMTGSAFLILSVRGLTHADANVRVNDKTVGQITPHGTPTSTALQKYWFTQMIAIHPKTLKNGNNKLEITATQINPAGDPNVWDNFAIKDVFCFYQHEQ